MNYRKSQVSEKREMFVKGLNALLDILSDIADGNDDVDFVDDEGNAIKLGMTVKDGCVVADLKVESKGSIIEVNAGKLLDDVTKRELKRQRVEF